MEFRVRLRPWLESRLNDGWIEGLKWIDKEKGIFKIPWKHHSKHTWTEDDAEIFKDWAVVTGRYREGVDIPDWPMWKTRLRCALNKAPDIQEVKQRHNLHCEAPFKVYRFISKTESLWRANATRNASMIFDGVPLGHGWDTSNKRVIPGNTLAHHRHSMELVQRASDFEARPISLIRRKYDGVLVRPNHLTNSFPPRLRVQSSHTDSFDNRQTSNVYSQNSNYSRINVPSTHHLVPQIISRSPSHICRISTTPFTSLCVSGFNSYNQQRSSFLPDIMEPEYHQLGVRIQHLNIRVKDSIVTNPNGCCIYFGRFDELNSPAAPDPIEAQIPHHVSDANKVYVDLLLDNMVRGIVLSVFRGSIFAERMCKCAVFVYVPTCDGDYVLLKKLGRRLRENIFDYDQFLADLRFYRVNQHTKPHFEVILAFGQQLKPGASSESLLVWCRVASCRAWFQLHKLPPMTPDHVDCMDGDFAHVEELPHSSRSSVSDNHVQLTSLPEHIIEQTDFTLRHRTSMYRTPNKSNGLLSNNSFIKLGDLESVSNENEFGPMSFTDSLSTDCIVTEQIIEEGVEVSLDDTDDLAYEPPSSVITDGLVICDSSHDVSSTNVCVTSSHDVFLNRDNSAKLKSDLLPIAHDIPNDNTICD